MPSTLAGLLVAIYLLIPGYCYYVVRRRTVPTRPLSTAVEGVNLVVVAMLANAVTLALYGLAQAVPFVRDHSPSIVQILRGTESYLLESDSRLAYVGTWAAVLLAIASGLAVAIAYRAWPMSLLAKLFGKSLSDESVAYRAWPMSLLAKLFGKSLSDESVWHRFFFTEQPEKTYIYLECYLTDGSHTAGTLVWYNTDLQDHPDRELVLKDPITTVGPSGEPSGRSDTLAILSAREICQIIVTYVREPALDSDSENSDYRELEAESAEPNDAREATLPN